MGKKFKKQMTGLFYIKAELPIIFEVDAEDVEYEDKYGNSYVEEDYEISVDDVIEKDKRLKELMDSLKEKGLDNNLLELIAADESFGLSLEELQATMDPSKYVGRSKEQVENFLKNFVNPVLEANKELLGVKAEINV